MATVEKAAEILDERASGVPKIDGETGLAGSGGAEVGPEGCFPTRPLGVRMRHPSRLGCSRMKELSLGCSRYFHSHILETVLPVASASYSKAPHALFRRVSFCEAVLKKSMPR